MEAGLATVFQDPALIPDLTIEQNFRLTGIDTDQVRSWLETMELGDLDLGGLVGEFPLEALRLIDLARALSHDPQVLMLDEITAALPADQAEHVFTVMRTWVDKGRSVLFITHRLAEVLRMCDHATILRDGRNVAELMPGEGGEGRLVEAMLGREIAEEQFAEPSGPRIQSRDATLALEATNLSSRQHLNSVSFSLRAGEILGWWRSRGRAKTDCSRSSQATGVRTTVRSRPGECPSRHVPRSMRSGAGGARAVGPAAGSPPAALGEGEPGHPLQPGTLLVRARR